MIFFNFRAEIPLSAKKIFRFPHFRSRNFRFLFCGIFIFFLILVSAFPLKNFPHSAFPFPLFSDGLFFQLHETVKLDFLENHLLTDQNLFCEVACYLKRERFERRFIDIKTRLEKRLVDFDNFIDLFCYVLVILKGLFDNLNLFKALRFVL